MSKQTIVVPDIGTDDAAEVVEICVQPGDQLELEQSVIVLETDKASVEVPSSHSGKVLSLLINEGDQIKTGAAILELELDGEGTADDQAESNADAESDDESDNSGNAQTEESAEQQSEQSEQDITVTVPDVGDSSEVEVIEVCVKAGDTVEEGDSLIVLESDKASMEIPAPASGVVKQVLVNESDKVSQGQNIAQMGIVLSKSRASTTKEQAPATTKKQSSSSPISPVSSAQTALNNQVETTGFNDGSVYAGPSVRKLARQLGVNLTKVKATGPRNRCTKKDVREFVKNIIAGNNEGSAIPKVPAVDFSKFGEFEKTKLSKIQKLTAANMHRSWLNVPHVTQFDDADITDLEEYRRQQKAQGVKLTPVPFIIKACASTLRAEPSFNVSMDADGEHRIDKDYVHIGMAVDTPAGLVVPVIRDADKKSVVEISEEINALAAKARDGKLSPKEMQGGCFTVSSLGAIGGQGFTPIVNTPEVGILGVSKASFKPVWNGESFEPRFCVPLCLSYDHRAVNGADAGRFLTHLVGLLADHQQLL